MSRTSLFLLAGIGLLFLVSLALILRRPAPPGWPNGLPGGESVLAPQENSGGDVAVKVTPLVLKVGEKPQFRLELNTHSVELDFDVAKTASLIVNGDKIDSSSVWEGDAPGGHHRQGMLTFSDLLPKTTSVGLSLNDISGIPKREFTWQI